MNMPAVTSSPKAVLADIPLNQLRPYRNQRRKYFDPEALKQLAGSMKAHGQAQPILVRTGKPGPDGTMPIEPYEIIGGERRWRGAGLLNWPTIQAVIRDDLDDAGVEALHLVENLQRQDLTLEEECDGAAALVALVGFEKACQETGMSEAWMSRHCRLGQMAPEVQKLVRAAKVTSMEIAHDINQLKGYSERAFDDAVTAFEQKHTWTRPMSRQQLRECVKSAKEAFELKQKKADDKKKDREKLKKMIAADPSLKARLAAEKALDPATKRKERELKVRELNAEGERIEAELSAKLLQIAGFDLTKPKKNSRRNDSPITVSMRSRYQNHGHEALPSSAELAEYGVTFNGSINVIAPALNLLAPGAKLSLYEGLDDITQDEARKIEAALGRPLGWEYYAKSMPCKKLRLAIDNAQNAGKAAAAKAAGKPGPNLSVSDFLAVKVTKKKGSKVKASDLHESYSAWCEEFGRKHEILPLNGGANEFGAAIAKAKIERKREKTGYQYLDIELKA